jgi:hypothetical protein
MIYAPEHASTLHVERFRCQYLIPADHPAPVEIKAKLDSDIQDRLPRNLAALLSRLLPTSDEGIWLIRRLEVDLDLNLTWESDRLMGQWALSIARSLVLFLQEDGDGHDVLYFPNRPSYLARFILDLIQGSAWGCWYYEPFEGLRLLPLSAALRTAICEDPLTGLQALLSLQPSSLGQAVHSLSVNDARRVLALLSEGNPSTTSGVEPREALHRYLEAIHEVMERTGAETVSAGKALDSIRMADLIAKDALASTQIAEMNASDALATSRKVDLSSNKTLSSLSDSRIETSSHSEPRFTPFGGAFLLLPMIASMNLEKVVGNWPSAGESPALVALRLILLLKCLGNANTYRAMRDNLLRDLLAVPPELDVQTLKSWQARLSPAQLDELLFALRDWKWAPNDLERQEWLLARLPRPGRSVALLLDIRLGIWCLAAGFSSRTRHTLVQRLYPWLRAVSPDAVLHCDPSLEEVVAAVWTGGEIYTLEADLREVLKIPETEPARKSDLPVRLEQLTADLDYLTLPAGVRGPAEVDLVLSIVAQNLLRAFSRRLPGFSNSGFPYLYANFLDFPARLEKESDRRVVSLGRPPLGLILNITGMARSTYSLDWLDEQSFTLHPED